MLGLLGGERGWGEDCSSIMDMGFILSPTYIVFELFTCKIFVVLSTGAEGSICSLFLDREVF